MSSLLRGILSLTLFFILISLTSPRTYCKENAYYDLFDLEYSRDIYGNLTYEKFEQAKAYREEYPFYAFNLLMESYKYMNLQRALNLSEMYGKEDACLTLMDEASDKYSIIEKELKGLEFKTLPAHEWSSLSFETLREAGSLIGKASDRHAKGDFDSSLALLVEALTSIHRAEDFLSIAKERNNGTFQNISYKSPL